MQSIFYEINNFLNEGRLICFSGTPCQVEGLKSFLGKDYKNLVLVDVVCRAVPSPKFLRKYLQYISDNKLKYEKIKYVSFRNKDKYGYKYTQMKISSDNYLYEEGVETDPYLRAFFRGYSIRPSCGECKFKKRYRESDITIWDCFNVENFDKSMDDNIGTTRVLIHSSKGRKLFDNIKNNFTFIEVPTEDAINGSKEMISSTDFNANRKEFFKDFNSMDLEILFNKYFPINTKTKIEKFFRVKLINLPFYKKIKKIAKQVVKRG